MKKIFLSAKGLFVVVLATLNVKVFRKIKVLINTFFFEDYKSLIFGLFIAASLLYKYFDIFNPQSYYLNIKVKNIKKNGVLVLGRNYHDENIKIHGIVLPSLFDKCSGKFKTYFVYKMNEYLARNNYLIDVKIVKNSFFFKKEGVFFIKNKDIQEYINNIIFLKNTIPAEKQNDWCYILDKSNFNPESVMLKINKKFNDVKDFMQNKTFQIDKYF